MSTELLDELLCASPRKLKERLAHGVAIQPEQLDDRAYRGISLGLPQFVERLSWKTFQKVFHRDPHTRRLRGWNVRLKQTGIEGPIVAKQKRGKPVTFGHYQVVSPSQHRLPHGCGQGLLIHYGLGGNGLFDPVRFLRDPLVALQKDDPSCLLGYSYLQLGPTRVPSPSYFLLTDPTPLTEVVPPPG